MTWVILGFSDVPGKGLRAVAVLGVQAAMTRAFARAAGGIDEPWRQLAIRRRLADPNLLPAEAARLERLVPASPAAPAGG